MRRAAFHTLGCKLNYTETSQMARTFQQRDFTLVPFGEPADVTVINTCTVTEQAEQKCRQAIRKSLRANPDTFVIVTGCYAQLRPTDIAEIPGVDAVLGAQEKFQIFSLIESFSKPTQTQIAVSCIDETAAFGPAYATGERTRAFLKVQDGCDYICSFCTIPMARGKSRSQSVAATVAQAREIAEQGYQEIVLSGVNIGLYGQTHGTDLLTLLRALEDVDGIARYRISSIEPNLLTNAIIDFVADSPHFQPHFHLPLQSGDDHVLGKMRRRYKRDLYAEKVAHIKARMPDACIGGDVIVGFPAEDERAFENTYRFINELPVSYLHVFTYSERPNTTAVDHLDMMGTPIPKAERRRRSKMLQMLSTKKRQAFYASQIGTARPVLWEDAEQNGVMHGFTDNYVKVQTAYDPLRTGTIEDIILGDFTENGLLDVKRADTLSLPVLG